MIFFTCDLEQYKNNIRGFYFDLFEDAPGPAVTDNAELLNPSGALITNSHINIKLVLKDSIKV